MIRVTVQMRQKALSIAVKYEEATNAPNLDTVELT